MDTVAKNLVEISQVLAELLPYKFKSRCGGVYLNRHVFSALYSIYLISLAGHEFDDIGGKPHPVRYLDLENCL